MSLDPIPEVPYQGAQALIHMPQCTEEQFKRLRECGEQDFFMPEGHKSPCSPARHYLACRHWMPCPWGTKRRCNPEYCMNEGAHDVKYWPFQGEFNTDCLTCAINHESGWLCHQIRDGRGISLVERSISTDEKRPWERSRIQIIGGSSGMEPEVIYYDIYRPIWEAYERTMAEQDGIALNFVHRMDNEGIINIMRKYESPFLIAHLQILSREWPDPRYLQDAGPAAPANDQTVMLARIRKFQWNAVSEQTLCGGYATPLLPLLSAKRLRFFLYGGVDSHAFGVYRAAYILSGGIPICDLDATDENGHTINLQWLGEQLSSERASMVSRIDAIAENARLKDLVFQGEPDRLTRLFKNAVKTIVNFEQRLIESIDASEPDHRNHLVSFDMNPITFGL